MWPFYSKHFTKLIILHDYEHPKTQKLAFLNKFFCWLWWAFGGAYNHSGLLIFWMNSIIYYRILTTETNSKALHVFCCLLTTSSVKLFVVNVQIFVYKCVFFRKRKNNTHKTFHILKMKAHFEKEMKGSLRWPFQPSLLYYV